MNLRTPLILVAGWRGPIEQTAHALLRPGTILVRYNLTEVYEGIVRRTMTTTDDERDEILELAHGCVSCTLNQDLLPLLRRLHDRSNVDRIVLLLDPLFEPEALCWAIEHVMVTGIVGRIDAPASRDVRIEGTITCVDAATWLDDATGDEELDDERTLAQVVVGQVEFADALVVCPGSDGWQQARLHAVLSRLAPDAPVIWGEPGDIEGLLRRIPPTARRGTISDAHSPLLRGQPPLDEDCGVHLLEYTARRPFHPERLHEAIDALLDGVVRSRGRAWVATQPDNALLLESAGGGLRVAHAGPWLTSMEPEQLRDVSSERQALAALRWDERFGDRDTSLAILTHDTEPDSIRAALDRALLTDAELAKPHLWTSWNDPFGNYHEDPCEPSALSQPETSRTEEERRR
ncbi:ribosome hibernation factor-recruiting GTPase MRF [Rhodococcus sp. NPDC060090]|uniref:ribosome hibernation factor-recruiting GTPase MRF n=1 Tax=Rhodococcus sp. NPDC060090 TaxID=3347056 RepID=UPI0036695A00